MALGQVTETRVKPADRRERPIALPAPVVGLDPRVDGFAHDRRQRSTRSARQLLERMDLSVTELHLHTLHVHMIPRRTVS